MIIRAARRLFSADLLGLLLLSVALQALTYGIASSLRNTDTQYFFWVCLLAALLAFELSRRQWDGVVASIGMLVLGIFGAWIVGARLMLPLLELGRATFATMPQVLPTIRQQLPIDTTGMVDAWRVVAEASHALSLRFQTWLMSLNGDVTTNDPLIRNLIWLLIMWLLSGWTGWFAGRRNAIMALLPSILLLAAITSYSGHRIYTLWVIVIILLLLMGFWNYRNHTAQWEQYKVDYSDSIRYDVTQAVVFLSLVIGAIAFLTPSVSWREIRDFLRERGKNEIAETLGVQQQQIPVHNVSVPVQKPSLPRDHLLSGGFAQSQQIVMTIRTGELPPLANTPLTTNPPRYYWRSTTYDTYMGAGWVTSSAPGQRFEPNTPLIPGLLNGYKNLHLDVEMVEPEGKLFWSGILFSADVPLRADWRLRPPSNLFANQADLLQADLFAAASATRTYKAESYVPIVTVEELRDASTDYPEFVHDHYLQLPRELPERVRALAQEITQDKQTAYDKAKALEAYLRTYPYDLDVPIPPEDQDVADYFLFDLKKGYCDYYATAMVVLARASGIPARFVSGYASGFYDAANARYVVQELHAHSWAEIYFPEIGWIEFEPTAAQPEIVFPPSNQEIPIPQHDETANRLLNQFRLEMLLYWLSPIAILLFAFILYFIWVEPWLYMRLTPAIAVEKIYRQLYRLGRPLAGERTRAETTYEFMEKLINNLNLIKQRSHFNGYLLHTDRDMQQLTNIYQTSLFAQNEMGKSETRTALNIWKTLRLRLLIARLQFGLNERLSRLTIRIVRKVPHI